MKQITWDCLSEKERRLALSRPAQAASAEVKEIVRRIIEEVKARGNAAVRGFTEKFDKIKLGDFKVSPQEFKAAQKKVSSKEKAALKKAAENIFKFHQAQKPRDIKIKIMDGVVCEWRARPVEKAGLYVPAGTAPLPSTLLMLGIPSKIAGCERRIVCTPPNRSGEVHPATLLAAELCGIRDVYKIGGAQAIAAMAYGTESVPKMDKIFGPGNAYVTEAKLQAAQDPDGAAMDLPAGPSEVMILADAKANAAFVAADLLSQAEHAANAQAVLVTTDKIFAGKVEAEIEKQLRTLPRQDFARAAIANSFVIFVKDLNEAVEVSNAYAPEHLIIQVEKPEKCLEKIRHAGSIFLGPWSPEPVGDYASGTNHVLPTSGCARAFGGVTLMSFMKTMTVQKLTRDGLRALGPVVETLAAMEGLEAHKRAVSVRLEK
ncbi:MAG: histidinol dehydrogenase [bacterium]